MKYTFETAFVFLKQGKRIRRASWDARQCLRLKEDGLVLLKPDFSFGLLVVSPTIRLEELIKDDWEVMDEA